MNTLAGAHCLCALVDIGKWIWRDIFNQTDSACRHALPCRLSHAVHLSIHSDVNVKVLLKGPLHASA